jgi:hypothetical protein
MKSHFQALYNHVYEGLENPPKLNALAVLRWRTKTREQAEAKAEWEAAEERSGHFRLSPSRLPSPYIRSPVRAMHSSIVSAESSSRMRPSTDGRPGSTHSSDQSRKPYKPAIGIDAWTYSIEDVSRYKACEGVVNYFVPPSRPISELMNSNDGSVEMLSKIEESAENGSFMGGGGGNDRIASASTASLLGEASPETSVAGLSRSTSIETGKRSRLNSRDQTSPVCHPGDTRRVRTNHTGNTSPRAADYASVSKDPEGSGED